MDNQYNNLTCPKHNKIELRLKKQEKKNVKALENLKLNKSKN